MKTPARLLKNGTLLSILIVILSLTSCKRDDDTPGEPEFYFSTTEFYGKNPDSTQIRNEAVGKWYDATNDNLLINIPRGYKNPDFPGTVNGIIQKYYVYDLQSNVDYYPIPTEQRIPEVARYGNNVNVGGMMHLIVEGNTGWLWVMKNTPERIKVVKK